MKKTILISFFFYSLGIYAQVLEVDSPLTDQTQTLTQLQSDTITNKLLNFEKQKGSQIAVVIINSLHGEAIEDYSINLAEKWEIGRKGVDDGVILLIVKKDRKLRIEVGYGLEGSIPDAKAAQIINQLIVPKFKQGDFYAGVNSGVDAIISLIHGEKLPPVDEKNENGIQYENIMILILVFICFCAIYTVFYKKWILAGAGFVLVFFGGLYFGLAGAGGATGAYLAFSLFGLLSGYLDKKEKQELKKYHATKKTNVSNHNERSPTQTVVHKKIEVQPVKEKVESSNSTSSSSYSGSGGSFGGGGANGSW